MARFGSRWSPRLLWAMAVASPVCAAADSAAPQGYDIVVTGQTVRICLESFAERACPDDGLLRRDEATGQVVEITTCDGSGCFQDDCVPAGEYQYGLKTPLACVQAAAYTEFFHEATVPAAAGGDGLHGRCDAGGAILGLGPLGGRADGLYLP